MTQQQEEAKVNPIGILDNVNSLFKGYNWINKLGSTGGTTGLSATGTQILGGGSSAPLGFTGTATGEAFAGGSTMAPGMLSNLPMVGAAAFATWVGSKIYEGFTGDHPHLNFHGNNIKYGESSGGTGRDESSYTKVNTKLPNHGGHASNAGFDYVISAKDLGENSSDIADGMRDYLDGVFTQIQSKTSVDINKIIPYAMDGLDITSGENPQQLIDRIVNTVQESVKKWHTLF